jgi:hypothetical protein
MPRFQSRKLSASPAWLARPRKKCMKVFLRVIQAMAFCCPLIFAGCGGGKSAGTPNVTVPPIAANPGVLPELHILVLGQSVSSNCNEKIYPASPNVFQVSLAGDIKTASDPFEWADCKAGSMWMPLGRMLIESGMASKVVFMPIGIGSTTVADWMQGGRSFSKLNNAIDVIKQRNLQFDYAFWHQGTSDFGQTGAEVYSSRLSSVISYVNRNVTIKNWLIAVHSRCYGTYDRQIESGQLAVAAALGDNIFVGANNNSLDNSYRFDTCHLNAQGQEAMAKLWLESMKSAK